MKRARLFVPALVLSFASLASGQTGTISGTVTSAATTAPLAEVMLRLYDANGQALAGGTAFTDASGQYSYSNLAPGSYFVKTTTLPAVYVHQLHNGTPCVAEDCVPPIGAPLVVTAGATIIANFAVVTGGVISGTVRRAPDNVVLPNVLVFIYSASGSFIKFVMTIQDGTYTVTGLPSGTYFARTSFGTSQPVASIVTTVAEMYGGTHCPHAFQGECRVVASTPIAVTAGATTSGIDFLLDEGGRIAGRVTAAATGLPLGSIGLSAYVGDVEVASTGTLNDGTYEFRGLPAGNYSVRTRTLPDQYVHEWYNDVCVGCAGTPAPVPVTAGATTGNINLALSTGAVITGTVTCPANAFIAPPTISAYSASGVLVRTGVNTGTVGPPALGCTAFTYMIGALPPGQYYVLARDTPVLPFNPQFPGGGSLVDQLYGGIDCVTVDCDVRRGAPISVGAGGTVAGIDFVMRFGFSIGVTIDGRATTFSDTMTIYDARGVALTSVNFSNFRFGGQSFVGLPRGTYYVKVNGILYPNIICADCPPTSGTPIALGDVPYPAGIVIVSPAAQAVSGTVRDAAGVTPLSAITVELVSDAGVVVATAATNLDGLYRMAGIAPGTYFARTRNTRGFADELFSEQTCPTCEPRAGTPIVVGGSPVTGIDFTLAASGVVTGIVADTGGTALANVPVTLFTAGGSLAGRTQSSASGRYSFETVAGSYRARAEASAAHGAELFNNVSCTSGACDVASGSPIAVAAGAITSNVNFSLAGCSSMTLTPSLLATAVAGRTYRQVFGVVGGTGPMSFRLTSGALPTGVSLDSTTGVLVGTPTVSGRHDLSIGATDVNGCGAARSLTLDVHECAFVLSPSSATVPAAGGTVTINITDACGSQNLQNIVGPVHEESNVPGRVVLRVDANPAQPWSRLIGIGRRFFTLRQAGTSTTAPFGAFDAPLDGSQASGSMALGGWALDNFEVARVQIYRDPIGGEGAAPIYLGDAVFVPGARPDVAQAYPTYPFNDRAGWGFLILTNMLPGQGNGTFRISAYADDTEGGRTMLGAKTIVAANATSATPFGAIDTPAQGATISGTSYVNFGWALTPLPHMIPIDGSTLHVLVDGMSLGHPTYNQFRADIASLFPGLANSNGAVGYRYIDTTALAEGLHTLAWLVYDSAGSGAGIGSRYFYVANSADAQPAASSGLESGLRIESLPAVAAAESPVVAQASEDSLRRLDPDRSGARRVRLKAMERLELSLEAPSETTCAATWAGYLVDRKTLERLPVGAAIDPAGTFYWQPGPGFSGTFDLQFVRTACDGSKSQLPVTVTIGR